MTDLTQEIMHVTIHVAAAIVASPVLWFVLKCLSSTGLFEWAGWAKPSNKQLVVATIMLTLAL